MRRMLDLNVLVVGMFILGAVLATASLYLAFKTEPAFEPLRVENFEVLNTEPVSAGEDIQLLDGVCNQAGEVITGHVVLGAQTAEQGLTSDRVILIEKEHTFIPGCIATRAPLTGPLPSTIGPGQWRFFIELNVDEGEGRRQRISRLSNIFSVR